LSPIIFYSEQVTFEFRPEVLYLGGFGRFSSVSSSKSPINTVEEITLPFLVFLQTENSSPKISTFIEKYKTLIASKMLLNKFTNTKNKTI
jgi:hypothetical protein